MKKKSRNKHIWKCMFSLMIVVLAIVTFFCVRFFVRKSITEKFYTSIMWDEVNACEQLSQQHPWLINSCSPVFQSPSGLTIMYIQESPLSVAIMFKSTNTFNWLISNGADINADSHFGPPPLFRALYHEYFFAELIKAGADPTKRGRNLGSVIEWAVESKKTNIVDILMEHWNPGN